MSSAPPIVHWNAEFTFRKKFQAVSFITMLLEEEIDFHFSYTTEFTATSLVHIVTLDDMAWANNLTTVARLLEVVDYRMD